MEKFLILLKNELKRLFYFIFYWIYTPPRIEKEIVNQFHKLYYNSYLTTWMNTFWCGIPTQKCPLDLWIYQEIVFEVKPDIIIECGTKFGGTALFLACVCDLLNKGKIVTVDIEEKDRLQHERITYFLGSSTSSEIVEKIRSLIRNEDRVMVILDSDHHREHVLNELRLYSKFVTKESYLIVEDSDLNGHPVFPGFGPGPMEAIKEFLKENKNFVIDKKKEKFYLTFSPDGFLLRIN